jgi:hypothetical protein
MGKSLANQGLPAVLAAGALILMGSAVCGPPQSRAMSQIQPPGQDFVRRVHREGLPVARLFESKSALVHLGLSPKGKPGLRLVQKTH